MATDYTVQGPLGKGGMGHVYRARQISLNRQVALKFLHPDLESDARARERFRREVKLLCQLSHAHIVKVFDSGVLGGRPFFTMELVEGRSLHQLLREEGPLAPDRVVGMMSQTVDALLYLHDRGIRHRDLKPKNILLTDRDHIVLVDFGLATAAVARPLTLTHEVVGTVAYLAPEIILGEEGGSPQDIWALGAVAHELLTSVGLFAAATPLRQAERIMEFDPARLDRGPTPVEASLREIIASCLARAPAERPTARELAGRLKELESRLPDRRSRPTPVSTVGLSGSTSRLRSTGSLSMWPGLLFLASCVTGVTYSMLRVEPVLGRLPATSSSPTHPPGRAGGARREAVTASLREIHTLLSWGGHVGSGGERLAPSRDPFTGAVTAPPAAVPSILRALVLLDKALEAQQASRIDGDSWFDLADAAREILMQVEWCRGFDRGSPFESPLARLKRILPSVGSDPAAICFRKETEAHLRQHELPTGARKQEEAGTMAECAGVLESLDTLRPSTPRELVARIVYFHLAATYSGSAQRDYSLLEDSRGPDLGAEMRRRMVLLGPRALREVPHTMSGERQRTLDILARHTAHRLQDPATATSPGAPTLELARLLVEAQRQGEFHDARGSCDILRATLARESPPDPGLSTPAR